MGRALLTLLLVSWPPAAPEPAADFAKMAAVVAEREGVQPLWRRTPEDDAAVAGQAAAVAARGMTLSDAVRLALVNNPGVQARFEDIGVARSEVVQAGLPKIRPWPCCSAFRCSPAAPGQLRGHGHDLGFRSGSGERPHGQGPGRTRTRHPAGGTAGQPDRPGSPAGLAGGGLRQARLTLGGEVAGQVETCPRPPNTIAPLGWPTTPGWPPWRPARPRRGWARRTAGQAPGGQGPAGPADRP